MATASIVRAWSRGGRVYVAFSVAGDRVVDGEPLAVEYTGETALRDAAGAIKPPATLKAECVADVKAKRDAALAAFNDSVIAFSGAVEL